MNSTLPKLIFTSLLLSIGVQTAEAARIGGGGSVGMSRPSIAPSRPAYSPARQSYAGAAAKPSAPSSARTTTPPPAAPSHAASNQTSYNSGSSGSFWTPFILGYLVAGSSNSKAAPAATHSHAPAGPGTDPQQLLEAPPPKPSPIAQTGPFMIDIPGPELLDGDCQVTPGAKAFIASAKIPNSVLFISLPPEGRCEHVRARLRNDLRPAILVRSDVHMVQLFRAVASEPTTGQP